jgi:hypothetical protein
MGERYVLDVYYLSSPRALLSWGTLSSRKMLTKRAPWGTTAVQRPPTWRTRRRHRPWADGAACRLSNETVPRLDSRLDNLLGPSLRSRAIIECLPKREPACPACPMHEKSSGFPWGTHARQKNQALGQKQRAPWKTRSRFSCMGHAVSRLRDLTSLHLILASINSSTLVGRIFAVEKNAPVCPTYSTYLHSLHTNFL